MLNIPANDVVGNVAQAVELERAGCDIIRTAVPDLASVRLIYALKGAVKLPVVADIHFDYKIALECAAAGVDKIRINPGNIGGEDRVKAVAKACMAKNIPSRIGVNSGSVEKEILARYGHPTAAALCESALYHASLLEKFDFNNIVISIKSSNVKNMIEAYRMAADACEYPLHLGVTEAGTERIGVVKSAIGIGSLLADGIGDTIRVSLTAEPLKEVAAGRDILAALGMNRGGMTFVSCPTCGRTQIDLISLANRAQEALCDTHKEITVAIMGCAVNGPGEAKEADIGIAAGKGGGLIFKKGEIIRRVEEAQLLEALLEEIELIPSAQ
jgi:(E)-4-hydroxy-3-methylbut-2-enyl-diphosphate synthase